MKWIFAALLPVAGVVLVGCDHPAGSVDAATGSQKSGSSADSVFDGEVLRASELAARLERLDGVRTELSASERSEVVFIRVADSEPGTIRRALLTAIRAENDSLAQAAIFVERLKEPAAPGVLASAENAIREELARMPASTFATPKRVFHHPSVSHVDPMPRSMHDALRRAWSALTDSGEEDLRFLSARARARGPLSPTEKARVAVRASPGGYEVEIEAEGTNPGHFLSHRFSIALAKDWSAVRRSDTPVPVNPEAETALQALAGPGPTGAKRGGASIPSFVEHEPLSFAFAGGLPAAARAADWTGIVRLGDEILEWGPGEGAGVTVGGSLGTVLANSVLVGAAGIEAWTFAPTKKTSGFVPHTGTPSSPPQSSRFQDRVTLHALTDPKKRPMTVDRVLIDAFADRVRAKGGVRIRDMQELAAQVEKRTGKPRLPWWALRAIYAAGPEDSAAHAYAPALAEYAVFSNLSTDVLSRLRAGERLPLAALGAPTVALLKDMVENLELGIPLSDTNVFGKKFPRPPGARLIEKSEPILVGELTSGKRVHLGPGPDAYFGPRTAYRDRLAAIDLTPYSKVWIGTRNEQALVVDVSDENGGYLQITEAIVDFSKPGLSPNQARTQLGLRF